MFPEAGAVTAALLGALAYGTGDFLGGRASLRLSTPCAVAIAQTVAVAYMSTLYLQSGAPQPGSLALGAGLIAGLSYAMGLMLLYHGFAHGRIGITAPLCGLFAILVPLAGDLHLQRPMGEWGLIGIGFCALAVVFIGGSALPGDADRSAGRSAGFGIASGVGYGIADLVLGLVPNEAASSTLLVTRAVAAIAAFGVLGAMIGIARHRRNGRQASGGAQAIAMPLIAGGTIMAAAAGGFDLLGQIGYIVSASHGSMGLAAALVALFPAVSVLLAVIVLKERITQQQFLGFAASIAGVILVSV